MDDNTALLAKIAYVNSQAASAMIDAMGMQAENQIRQHLGQSPAYNDKSFFDLIEKYGLYHNNVISELYRP